MLRWVSNTYDPERAGRDPVTGGWLQGKFIGKAKATERHTVEELEAMHMVGVYVEEAEDEQV